MNYLKYTIGTTPEYHDIILAELTALPFEAFEEETDSIAAYAPEADFTPDVNDDFLALSQKYSFRYDLETIAPQNWNALWEASFQPIIVDDFCAVRASFHAALPNVQHDLIIDPKMAFGTGHHETTFMVMQLMRNIDFTSKKVFDYGCGTGILAILAAKLHAAHIDAIDIEEESYHNTQENALLNGTPQVAALHGTLEQMTETVEYDIILANINRNVIIASLARLFSLLKPTGTILFSGFILSDEELLQNAATATGFTHQKTLRKGNWLAMEFVK